MTRPLVRQGESAVRDLLRRRGIRLHDSVIAELATAAERDRYRQQHGSRAFAKATILPFLDYLANHYSGDMEMESAVHHLAHEVFHAR